HALLGPQPGKFYRQKPGACVFNISIVRNGVNADFWIRRVISFRCSKEDIRANGIAFAGDIDNELFAACQICDPEAFLENPTVGTQIKAKDRIVSPDMRRQLRKVTLPNVAAQP